MKKITAILGAAACAAVLALTGCDGNKATTGGDGGKKLTLDPSNSVSIRAGETADLNVAIKREKFDDAVTITISDLPDGVTVESGPAKFDKGVSDAKFKLKASDTAKPATDHPVKVAADGGGMKQSTTVKLTVKAKDPGAPPPATADSKRNDWIQEQQGKVNAAEEHVKALDAAAVKATGEAKTNLEKEAANWRKKHADMKADLDRAKTTPPDGWDKFKANFENTLNDFNKGAKDALNKIK